MPDNPDIWTAMNKIDALRGELRSSIEKLDNKFGDQMHEMDKAISAMHTMIIERDSARKDDIAKLEKNNLTEGFGIKQQLAFVVWRIGAIIFVAGLIGSFVLKDLHLDDIFNSGPPPKVSAKR